LAVEKQGGFTIIFSRFLHTFFHHKNVDFQSVGYRFLPIINMANKNNNYIKLNNY
jgi:hypothetical protein